MYLLGRRVRSEMYLTLLGRLTLLGCPLVANPPP